MSEKRRDNRNRILRNGESQRKDGRYAFKYIDATGKPQFVYSWKLEKTDKLPTGKSDDLSLRAKEKLIQPPFRMLVFLAISKFLLTLGTFFILLLLQLQLNQLQLYEFLLSACLKLHP